jgi:hypothetical protein
MSATVWVVEIFGGEEWIPMHHWCGTKENCEWRVSVEMRRDTEQGVSLQYRVSEYQRVEANDGK